MERIKYVFLKTTDFLKDVYRFFFRPLVTMSNSRFSIYSNCPLKYSYYYEQGIKGFPNPHLHFGSAVHAALNKYHAKFDLRGEQGTLDDLIKEYEKAWDDLKEDMLNSISGSMAHKWRVALSEAGSAKAEMEDTLDRLSTIYVNDEEEERFKKRGVNILDDYFKDNQTNPNRIIALEKSLNMTFKGLDIMGYIDRIEKTPEEEIEVVDYKTGERLLEEEHIARGEDPQSMIYTMLVEKKWGKKLKNFYYYYLSKRKKVPCIPLPRHIEKNFENLVDTANYIKYERFKPAPGPLCDWCDYEIICPEWKGKLAPFKGIFKASGERARIAFSYSKMSTYKNCPYNYKKLYIDKMRPKPKSFFSIGHTCHETFEEFFSYPYQSSVHKLRKMYEKHWHSEGYKNEQEESEYFEQGWNWVKNYYDKFINGQYIRAHAVEFYFQLPIGNDYVINGFIDRLQKNRDGTFQIFDYKTDPKIRTQNEVDGDLQLTSYYWAMNQFGIEVGSMSLEFLKFSERITTRRNPEDIPLFIDEVNKTVGEMAYKQEELMKHPEKEEELFPPSINKYCGGCEQLKGCPKEREIRTIHKEEIMNLDDEPKAEPEKEDKEEKEEEKYGV